MIPEHITALYPSLQKLVINNQLHEKNKKVDLTPIGKRPLGRPRRRWEDNIRIDLKNNYLYEELGLFGLLEDSCDCGI